MRSPTALQNSRQQFTIHAVEFACMRHQLLRIFILPHDLSEHELHRRQMLGDKVVVVVNQLLDLLALIEPKEYVRINLVGREEVLQGYAKQMLFAVKVPEDERFAHLRGACHLCQGSGGIPLVGKEPCCPLENPFSRTHYSTVGEKKLAVNALGLAKRLGAGYQAASAAG